jgi:hypothetical protein
MQSNNKSYEELVTQSPIFISYDEDNSLVNICKMAMEFTSFG